MKKLFLLFTALSITFLTFYSCTQNDDEGVLIEGTVVNESTRVPISNALVQVSAPDEFSNVFSRTDSSGHYQLGSIDIGEITDLTIIVSAPGFESLEKSLRVTPDDQISGFNFDLTKGEGGSEPSGPSGTAASIEFVGLSNETINIAATGGVTTSKLTFEVQDSAGNSLDLNNTVEVQFAIISGPGGGETINPVVAVTDAQGQVTATLKSGNTAGVVQIEAKVEQTLNKIIASRTISESSNQNHSNVNLYNGTNSISQQNGMTDKIIIGSLQNNSTTQNIDPIKESPDKGIAPKLNVQKQAISITSQPIAVTIHGGFPDQEHFDITSEFSNYEYKQGLNIPITVSLGDKFSNPVKPGTAVYFSVSDGNGLIQGSAEGHTDEDGLASVNFRPNGTGISTITATTGDQSNNEIQNNINILTTSSSATILAPQEITIDAGGNEDIEFTVTDKNGYPMAPGTAIEVEIDTALILSGTTSMSLEDAIETGTNISDFKFNVRATNDFLGSANIKITVTTPSGIVTTRFIALNSSGGGVVGEPEEPASIELLSVSNETINIAESGGITNSDFTFQLKDAAGRNLNENSIAEVAFSIISNPGGAEVTPNTVQSNGQGRVTSNLKAGNSAGVVQIKAEVVGTDIISKPVAITIHGGFPDQDHFTLEPLSDTNIEGFNKNGVEILFKVRAGDEFSNPVKPGTAVYFETTGGVIDGSGVGHTDETGYTEVTLYAGNPRPSDGIGYVKATTLDTNGDSVFATSEFIFSTSKADISTEYTELELSPGESQSVEYNVFDLNGNPMASGTTIEVISEGDLELTGTTNHTLSNEHSTGINITDFSFNVSVPEDYSGSEFISIVVTSPSGTVTTNQDLVIKSTGSGVSGPPSTPAAIILENVENNSINIKETGGIVNTSFTFQVQDSSGRALNNDNPVEVNFEIIQGPGGEEGILPVSAMTNATGRVTSNLFSGNEAGVVRLRASINRDDGTVIQSAPVAITIHGGFPDLDHFSIAPDKYNFEGYNINGNENILTVIVGDKFSNPVKPGTAVYFETTGGVIEGSDVDHTDELGRASVTLLSANPRPADGIATVTAKTIDENNDMISVEAPVVFSTSGAIISATPTTFDLDPNGGASFSYTVEDLNGNPMAAGTEIEIETGEGIEVTGSGNFILGDHVNPGPGATEFNFSIRDIDDENNDPADLTILIKVTTPNGNLTTYDEIQGIRRKSSN